jgi:4-hydroxy-tetrahydrodipicolinate synthase
MQDADLNVIPRGVVTALITPFLQDGSIDLRALESIVSWQVDSGIHGLAPCGTTGEGATLTAEELTAVIGTVVETVGGRIPVIAGCGSNDTRKTVALAKAAGSAGADALLVVSPYYNKPNRTGMIDHYRAVCDSTALPVVVYNVPGRTGQDLGTDLILDLAGIEGVAGIKEASGNLEQLAGILNGRDEGLRVLSGDDPLALPAVALGADGVISVVSNEAPAEMSRMIEAALSGDFGTARSLHYRLLGLMRANFFETNPVPVKVAMAMLGHCREDLRTPLGEPSGATREIIRLALAQCGLREIDR